jgi:hypothetical protein
MQYNAAPQQRDPRSQRQRPDAFPRNQELQNFAAHSLSYVAEAPREESAPSVGRPVGETTYELDELPERSNQGNDKSGQAEANKAKAGKTKAGKADTGKATAIKANAGQQEANDAESDKEKPFCSIRGRFTIGPFPGWKKWFTSSGDA